MIRIDNSIIRLFRPGKNIREHSTDTLESIYCLQVGSDVFANDSTCYLLVFQTEMWLLPDTIPGLSALTPGKPDFPQSPKVIHASLDYLPYLWRANWYVLPGTKAKLKVIPRKELATFIERLSIADPGPQL